MPSPTRDSAQQRSELTRHFCRDVLPLSDQLHWRARGLASSHADAEDFNGVTGTLGVAAVAIALGMGAMKILGVGRSRELLERVQQMVPGRVATISSEEDLDLVAWAQENTGDAGVDLMYDCLGVGGDSHCLNKLLRPVSPGGRAVLVAGGVTGDVQQTYWNVLMYDVHTVGSLWFSAAEIDQMIDLSFLEHRRFGLLEVNEAFDLVGSRPGGFANVVVLPGQSTAGAA